jgi:hypothetical protein
MLSKMKHSAWLLFLLVAGAANAQTIMDGASIPTTVKGKLDRKIRLMVADPYSTQLADLRVTDSGALCGRFNAKNAMGAYEGFRPFLFDPSSEALTPLPDLRSFDIKKPNALQLLNAEEAKVNLIRKECPEL